MANRAEQDIEFLPSDELVEPEPADAEEAAVRPREAEDPMGLMTVEAEEFDAAELAQDVAEELELEADEAVEAAVETEATEDGVEAQHEEDLEEILHRHYGIVSAEPEVEPARRPTATEFVCASCYLRKPTSQLADPEHSICVDCAASGA